MASTEHPTSPDGNAPDSRCRWCGEIPWQQCFDEGEVFLKPCCNDQSFARFGDMLSINELSYYSDDRLNDPDHRRTRDEWLAEYTRAGLDRDQDPGSFTISVPIAEGES